MLASLAFVAVAYLIGSVSFAVVTSKLFGLPDPHSYGSGNPGATNVLRTGNKAAAALTLVGDGAKGWLAVFLAQATGPSLGAADWMVPAVALAVFVGHLFPVFHGFAGGKGVATAAGIVFALHWPLGVALGALWMVMALGFKISSLAALTTAALMPAGAFSSLQHPDRVGDGPDFDAAVLAPPVQHPAAAGRARAHDRALNPVGPVHVRGRGLARARWEASWARACPRSMGSDRSGRGPFHLKPRAVSPDPTAA
jgi:glycerol-3-phosphate acyltransferase PlsY